VLESLISMRWRVTIFGIVSAAAVQISLLPAEAGQWLSERKPFPITPLTRSAPTFSSK
jgi:hypothetical protein